MTKGRGESADKPVGPGRRGMLTGPLAASVVLGSDSLAGNRSGPDRDRLRLTFVEEFETLNFYDETTQKGRWRTQYGYGGVDSEASRCTAAGLACYVDSKFTDGRISPFSVQRSKEQGTFLEIKADHTPPDLADRCFHRPYTSGLLTTFGSFAQTYGYFEASIQVPRGKGYFPAFWGIPQDLSWSAEFDIFESLGEAHTTHLGVNFLPKGQPPSVPVTIRADLTGAFQTYGLWWEPEKVVWYVNDVECRRVPTPEGAHKPFFWLFDFAVGGDWAGTPTADTAFPASLRVAWFKAYELK
jgi:beta-glucanase (GH16 family)